MARQYTLKTVIAALRTHHGLLSLAADALGCARSTLYRYVDAYPEVAAVVEEERERLVDMAEDALFYHLTERSPWAISLVLRTLGKSRGYGDKMTGPDTRELGDTQEWQELQAVLLATLQPYPEARWAIVRALNGHGHEAQNGHTPGA
jgi:hypothetical protein